MKHIIITGKLHDLALERFAKESDLKVDYFPDLPRPELLAKIGQYDCIISRSETDIDQELIDKGSKLSVIARAAVGIGNIDVEYATKKGILVFNTPAKNTNSAAELTVMLMLAVMRKLPQAHKTMEQGGWNRHLFTGVELLDKKIGLIGLGNVGHRVAKFLRGFDCEVYCYDPYVTRDYCESHGATKLETLDQLVRLCDVISIHTPKNKETINMIGAAEIAVMKDGVYLINAARGGLINEAALAEGLKSGKIAGLGVDTWDVEPVTEHPLKAYPNVVMTPHIGASTIEAQERIAQSISEETIKALRGEMVSSPVNLPDVKVFGGKDSPRYASLAGKLGSFAKQYMGRDFSCREIEFLYRGQLHQDDWSLIKLSFLKGLLQGTVDTTVSYVNAMQIAEKKGIQLEEIADKDFSHYESAIRIRLKGDKGTLRIGGTVFGGKHLRLSYINGFTFEIEPEGHVLAIENKDVPGVIGYVGTVLGKNGVNINRFELSRTKPGDRAMALVVVDDEVQPACMKELTSHESILKVTSIQL